MSFKDRNSPKRLKSIFDFNTEIGRNIFSSASRKNVTVVQRVDLFVSEGHCETAFF